VEAAHTGRPGLATAGRGGGAARRAACGARSLAWSWGPAHLQAEPALVPPAGGGAFCRRAGALQQRTSANRLGKRSLQRRAAGPRTALVQPAGEVRRAPQARLRQPAGWGILLQVRAQLPGEGENPPDEVTVCKCVAMHGSLGTHLVLHLDMFTKEEPCARRPACCVKTPKAQMPGSYSPLLQ